MAAWDNIISKAFKNNAKIRIGKPQVIIKKTTGAPTSAAKIGTLCWNSYDENAYICTVAAGTWVKINA